MADNYTKGSIYQLDIATLWADPAQARKYIDPDSLAELTASIGKYGVLQPILFRQDEPGAPIFIVAGERRVEASRAAGLTIIPGIFVSGNHREISLVENLLRENLTPVEEAEALDAIMQEQGYNQSQLSEMIGKSQPIISQTLSINKLPADLRDQVRSNPAIPKTFLLAAAKLKTEQAMRMKLTKYLDKLNNPAKPVRMTKAQALMDRLESLQDELANLAWQDWTDGEKQDLTNRLRNLQQGADALLQSMGPVLQ
jgi:ParB family chromosome partitioning protein